MVGLAFASLVTWTIWLAKTIELMSAQAGAASARRLEEAESLEAAAELITVHRPWRGPVADLFEAALDYSRDRQISRRTASRNAFRSRCRASRRMPAAAWRAAPACWRRSARPRLSSACSVRSGASTEPLHRHFAVEDDQSRRRRAGHRRSAARHRDRPRRRHTRRHHLQRLRARHRRLPAPCCRMRPAKCCSMCRANWSWLRLAASARARASRPGPAHAAE